MLTVRSNPASGDVVCRTGTKRATGGMAGMRGVQGRLGRATVSVVVVAAGFTSLVASTEGAPKAAAVPVVGAAAPDSAALWTYNADAQAPVVCMDPPPVARSLRPAR